MKYDPEQMAAEQRKSAREDAEWKHRWIIGLGLIMVGGWIVSQPGPGEWYGLLAIAFFTAANMQAGKHFFWPKR